MIISRARLTTGFLEVVVPNLGDDAACRSRLHHHRARIAGGRFPAVFIRAPIVERVGDAVEVLARLPSSDGAGKPVLCRQGSRLVAAFHPELSDDLRLHHLFLKGLD